MSDFDIFQIQKDRIKRQKRKLAIEKFRSSLSGIKKPTATFWICVSILVASILIAGSVYFSGRDNGRYEYQDGLVIDKQTGDAKPIKIKRD